MVKRLLILVAVACVLTCSLFLSQKRHEPLNVSGFIEADEIRVGSRVGGRVREVHVEEGQVLRTSDTLVILEPFDLLERREQARAELAMRRAELDRLEAGFRVEEIGQAKARRDQLAAHLDLLVAGSRKEDIAAAQAQVDLAQAQLDLAQLEHNRNEALFKKNVTSKEELDRLTSEMRVAQQTLRARKEDLSKLQQGSRPEEITQAQAQLEEAEQGWKLQVAGYRREEIEQARAAVASSRASLAVIERQIAELIIRAPVNGVTEAVELRPGDLVGANVPILSIMDVSNLWVRAYLPENRLGVRVGQKVRVKVDSFPNEFFAAHVSFLARQAEFTPGNVQTPEERSKQVFRIKVTLDEGLDRLRPGMNADVLLE